MYVESQCVKTSNKRFLSRSSLFSLVFPLLAHSNTRQSSPCRSSRDAPGRAADEGSRNDPDSTPVHRQSWDARPNMRISDIQPPQSSSSSSSSSSSPSHSPSSLLPSTFRTSRYPGIRETWPATQVLEGRFNSEPDSRSMKKPPIPS